MAFTDSGIVATGMAEKVNRLLAISWSLPPYLSPRSLQVSRTLKQLTLLGWKIDVISQARSHLLDFGNLDLALEKYYKGSYRIFWVRGDFLQLPKTLLFRLFPSLEPIPDRNEVWANNAKKLGKKLAAEASYECMVSFGQPWSSHLVALEIKRQRGLPWVAHFSDPWADNPYNKKMSSPKRTRVNTLEQEVIANADEIIFTNKQTLHTTMKKYPANWRRKATVIAHGFISNSIPDKKKRAGLNLVHTGNLYGLRTPEKLLLALGELRSEKKLETGTQIQFVGLIKNIKKYRRLALALDIGDHVHFHGRVSYQNSESFARQADVLVLIDAPSTNESLFLPSKLVDYLPYQKPILGITPSKGAASDLLHDLKMSTVDPDDIKGMKRALVNLQKNYKDGKLSIPSDFKKLIKQYDIHNTSLSFDKVIRTAISS